MLTLCGCTLNNNSSDIVPGTNDTEGVKPQNPLLPPFDIQDDIPNDSDSSEESEGDEENSSNSSQNPKKKVYIKSNANGLNVRSGAGNYKVVGTMEKNDMLEYHGTEGNYYKTVFKEKTAYVYKAHAELLEFDMGSNEVESAISFGASLMGYPYVWGSQRYHWGNGKLNSNFVNGEFDCSALVQYVYFKTNKVILDMTSRTQSLNGVKVEKKDLRRGDLMFFTNASRKNKTGIERIGHVGIYFGGNYILHTASDYAVIEPISNLRWSYYITARRVV